MNRDSTCPVVTFRYNLTKGVLFILSINSDYLEIRKRVTRIELVTPTWKDGMLPLHHTRKAYAYFTTDCQSLSNISNPLSVRM